MLVLSRRAGENIVIGTDIQLTVVRVEGGRVRIGIAAPPSVNVRREGLRGNQTAGIVPARCSSPNDGAAHRMHG